MRWLLDTNAVIHAIRNRPPAVRARLEAVGPSQVVVSAITIAELWYGAEKSEEPQRRRALFAAFLEPFDVLSFDRAAGVEHGRLRFTLRHRPIGERDLLIAAIARVHGLVVVTNNVREFERVEGLVTEDWTESDADDVTG
jgi:tRNA(fMet)-specific endonuclease VapC